MSSLTTYRSSVILEVLPPSNHTMMVNVRCSKNSLAYTDGSISQNLQIKQILPKSDFSSSLPDAFRLRSFYGLFAVTVRQPLLQGDKFIHTGGRNSDHGCALKKDKQLLRSQGRRTGYD